MIYSINKELILENAFTQHFSNHGGKYVAGIGAGLAGLAGLGAGYLSSGDNYDQLSNSAQNAAQPYINSAKETVEPYSTAFKHGYRNNISEPAAWIGETVKDGYNDAYGKVTGYVGDKYNQANDYVDSKVSQAQQGYQQHLLDNQAKDAQLARADETAGLPASPTAMQTVVGKGMHGVNVAQDYLSRPIDARSAGLGAAGLGAVGALGYGLNRLRKR